MKIKARTLQLFVVVGILWRLLTSTLIGSLLLCLFLYYCVAPLFARPFGFAELLVWIGDLSESNQGLLFTSFLTIVGFVVAFQTATRNWQDELRATLRKEANLEIDETYARICELINSLGIYAQGNLDLMAKIESGVPLEEVRAGVAFFASQAAKFQAERQELAILGARANLLGGRHVNVLFATGNSWADLNRVNRRIGLVTGSKMWVTVPTVDTALPLWLEAYGRYVRVDQYRELASECTRTHQFVSAVTGGVKGKISASYAEFNFSFLVNFARYGHKFFLYQQTIQDGGMISDAEFDALFPPDGGSSKNSTT